MRENQVCVIMNCLVLLQRVYYICYESEHSCVSLHRDVLVSSIPISSSGTYFYEFDFHVL